jgi:zinc transporter ZupT
METPIWTIALWATGLGVSAAVALPMGAVASFFVHPSRTFIGGMAGFGSGALISALALELIAPHVQALEQMKHAAHSAVTQAASGHGDPLTNFYALLIGGVLGAVVFIVADQLLNAKGGFLRKYATSMAYLSRRKMQRNAEVLKTLAAVDILRAVPTAAVQELVEAVEEKNFKPEDVIFEQGDDGDFMLFVKSGEIELKHNGELLKVLGAGAVIGEIALLTGSPRTATATVTKHTEVLLLHKDAFDHLRGMSPELDKACRDLASERLGEIKSKHVESATKIRDWSDRAIDALSRGAAPPTKLEIKKAHEEFKGSPMAVWLGNFVDGVPETFVIGTGVLALVQSRQAAGITVGFSEVIPLTLVGGLFLSNFPEALSSALTMREQGYSRMKIFLLWAVLCLAMAVAAGVGVLVGNSLDPTTAVLIEGLAGGAMLMMVSSTMLPEAAHEGGPTVTGFATVLGFMAAVGFKLFE